MTNDANLIPFNKRTEDEQRELARKGGIASGEARRRKKAIAELVQAVLDAKVTSADNLKLGVVPLVDNSVAAAIFSVHANKAINGDVASARFILDTATKDDSAQPGDGAGIQFVVEAGDDMI